MHVGDFGKGNLATDRAVDCLPFKIGQILCGGLQGSAGDGKSGWLCGEHDLPTTHDQFGFDGVFRNPTQGAEESDQIAKLGFGQAVSQAGWHEGGAVALFFNLVEWNTNLTIFCITDDEVGGGLAQFNPGKDLSIRGLHNNRLVTLFDIFTRDEHGIDDVIELGSRTQAEHVRADKAAGIANSVAFEAVQIGSPENSLAFGWVAFFSDCCHHFGHFIGRKLAGAGDDLCRC